MREAGFVCKQCGHCCKNMSGGFQHSVDSAQVAKWLREDRHDILQWVDHLGGDIWDVWISPRTGDDVNRCPWLRKVRNQDKYVCKIHDTKTWVCADFPADKEHAIASGCRGYEN
jgi:hypothetical protein